MTSVVDDEDERNEPNRDQDFLQTMAQPGVRNFVFLGIAALILFYSQAAAITGELGTLVAVGCAAPGLIFRWLISPVLFLMTQTYLLCDKDFQGLRDCFGNEPYHLYPAGELHWTTLFMLALTTIVYVIAQYRVLSLVHQSMPDDPPPRRKGQPAPTVPRRPHGLFKEREIAWALVFGIVCSLFGIVAWKILDGYVLSQRLGPTWGITRPFSRFMLLFWVIGSVTFLAGAVFRYLRLLRMSKLEARLLLQDQLWQETRREQERIYRWRNWAKNVQRAKDIKRAKQGG